MSDFETQATFTAPIIEEVEALFPSYDIIRLIACGGMGAVYEAKQRSLDRPVAIKLLPREFSTDEAFRTGFEAEAKAMAKLNHPNLIAVYDFGEIDGMLYIVMEYVAGNSLFEAANGQAVEQSESIRIISDICYGLTNAHENGILHRDIKPANILLDANFIPKISDFGLARSLETQIQEGEQIFGTPGYTSPEVLEPPHSFDHRTDIFSVGVMLYELLTGILPTPDSPRASQVSSCSVHLDRIIQRAMHPDPNKRYDSATQIATDLKNIRSSSAKSLVTAGTAAASRPRPPAPKLKLKSTSSSGIGTTLMLLLILGGAGYAYYHFKIKPQSQENQPTEETTEQTPEIHTIEIGITAEPETADTQEEISDTSQKYARQSSKAIATFKQASNENYTNFTAELNEAITSLQNPTKETLTTALKLAEPTWNGKVPAKLPVEMEELQENLASFFSKQAQIDKKFLKKLSNGSDLYINSLEQQIAELQATGDQPSIDLIQAEIDLVQKDPLYFGKKSMEPLPFPFTKEEIENQ